MTKKSGKPNIIIMYADDLGFGDIGCYGATDIPTPNLDRLAASGLCFQRGYATAATCSPSRYSLLTGSYPWRNPRAAILPGDAASLIHPDQATLPGMLKQAGYATGVVGKWHLGLGDNDLDWNKDISVTPVDLGFDSSYIMAATNDRVPCVYIKDRRVVDLDPEDPIEVTFKWEEAYPEVPTGRHNPEQLRLMPSHGHDGSIINGVSRIGLMRGGETARWNDETMSDVFLDQALEFVTTHRDEPFFLYYAFHQPHCPRLPGPRFQGATKLGSRGDVIVEMDDCVGRMLDTLEALGLREDTIVIFSSDNGPVLDDGYADQAVEMNGTHRPAGPLRGGKYSMYDGGTCVPFILSWPREVEAGAESGALVSQVDFFASFASLAGQPLGEKDAPDSLNVLEALLGRDMRGREELVTEGTRARTVYHQGHWAYIPPYDGGPMQKGNETGNASYAQCYDCSGDVGQVRNLADEQPDRVAAMDARLKEIVGSSRTRP